MSPEHPLRRLLRQDKNDSWAVRLLPRVVIGVAVVYTLVVIASQSVSSFVALVALALLGGLVWLLRRRAQLLMALASTVVTLALTGYWATAADIARGAKATPLTGQAVFGYWALAGMALLGAWMVKEHPGRRGVTVVVADVILVIASVIGMFTPEAGIPIGFLGVLGVLAFRGSTAKKLLTRLRRVPTTATSGGKPTKNPNS
ncbi:hypothetical protein GCM10010260_48160 [Streptomyces filipinensis]|uniref:Uncharacterized protein n=1 Tax=Streptomyces filipinensis TaxID=66887 RepID=A0A918IDW1_9ACTN|nr:hypothetical protein [Streptomyces filipinensis]GGV05366.1 hypothetical protein GCM10010260_48160 [Streptomyces filipinensis]